MLGAVAAVWLGLLIMAVPSNRSSSSRLFAFVMAMSFAAILLWSGWRLWRRRRYAVLVALLLLFAQMPAFFGIGANYECAAPVGIYARVFLQSGPNIWYPALRRVQTVPFLPPISGYYIERYASCGGRLTANDPPLSSPRSFGWISINLAALFAFLVLLISSPFRTAGRDA
jgi:hypothetical protein